MQAKIRVLDTAHASEEDCWSYKRNIIKDKHTDTWLNVYISKLTHQPTKTYIIVSNIVYILIT